MNNLIVLPMVIPILTGIFLVFFKSKIVLQRTLSLLALLANIGVSFYLLQRIQTEGILRLDFGEWKPPFGILFVADSFAMLLVLTTSIVSALILIYSFSSTKERTEKNY